MIFDPQIFIHVAKAAEEAATESSSPIGTLGINLKLFIAQLINFGVILFVLWKWVFTPVAKKLQERTDKIEKSLNDADRISKEKQEFEAWRNSEIAAARKEASEVINASQTEAGKVKDQILNEAKAQQNQIVENAKIQIQQEKTKALVDAKSEIADLVTNAAEKILKSKLDSGKDKEFIMDALKNI
jgi:F-type H+-transporting ATPase subunit b